MWSYAKKSFIIALSLLVILLTKSTLVAATNDVTGLTPTLHMTFDQDPSAGSFVNDNGTAIIDKQTNEGTVAYMDAPNGRAMNTYAYQPYFDVGGLTIDQETYTVSSYNTLGTKATAVTWSLRNSGDATALVFRRGTTDNQLIITVGSTVDPVITYDHIAGGDTAFHHYALVVKPSGMTLYIDGQACASTTATESKLRNKLQFGKRSGGTKTGESANGGLLDDFRVYNTELTPSQIQAISGELSSKASEPGSISIKTGIRTTNTGHINHLSADTLLGAWPIARQFWNHTPQFNDSQSYSGVVSNLQNSANIATGAKLYYTFSSIWHRNTDTNTPNGALTRNYFDDGVAGAGYTIHEPSGDVVLPETGHTRGWETMLTGIPYAHADLLITIASDQGMNNLNVPALMVKVDNDLWKYYYGLVGARTTVEGNQTWRGASYSNDNLVEGYHYLRIPLNNVTPITRIFIAHNSPNASNQQRCGLAALQLVAREAADTTPDPYYRRAISGFAQWQVSDWENSGQGGLPWQDSSAEQPTEAILQGSGNVNLTPPAAGLTANSISFRGTVSSIILNPGTVNLIGKSLLNSYETPHDAYVQFQANLNGDTLTLAANNPNADNSSGCTVLSGNNSFNSLSLISGTLMAGSSLPANALLDLNGGNLIFTATQSLNNPLGLSKNTNIRVLEGITGTLAGPLTGTSQLKKRGKGNLVLSGGGSLGDLVWTDTTTISFIGDDPFTLPITDANGTLVTLELYAPMTFTDCMRLGHGTIKMNADSDITVNSMRFGDGGANRESHILQDNCTVTVTGNDIEPHKYSTLVFTHWNSLCNYQMRSSIFLAPEAVAMLAWDGTTYWDIQDSEVTLKGFNMIANGGKVGAVDLRDSLLQLGSSGIFSTRIVGERTISLTDSTLQARDNFVITENALSTPLSLKGDVTFDANGFAIECLAPLTGLGRLSITSTANGGELILANANDHTGGTLLQDGTLRVAHADALGLGGFEWEGGTLALDVNVSLSDVTLEEGKALRLRAGDQPSWRNSGSLSVDNLTLNASAANPFTIVLDLNGLSRVLSSYPLILGDNLPPGTVDKLAVELINPGEDLPETTKAHLVQEAQGIFVLMEDTLSVQRLFWRNGLNQGTWSADGQGDDWAIDNAAGALSAYSLYDGFTLGDTDQGVVILNLDGLLNPAYFYANASNTDYLLQGLTSSTLLEIPATGFVKSGAGVLVLDVPLAITNAIPLEVEEGVLQINRTLGFAEVITFDEENEEEIITPANLTTPLIIGADGTFAVNSALQEFSGAITGAGTFEVRDGYTIWNTTGENFEGNLTVSGGILDVFYNNPFQNRSPQIRVESGATMLFSKTDSSGYGITTNTHPLHIAGTLKILARDTNTRGLMLYDGAEVLLQGDKDGGLDMFRSTTFSLVSGNAIIKPLNEEDKYKRPGSIRVRSENPEIARTFDIMDPVAVLTLESRLVDATTKNLVVKNGAGTLRSITANSTKTSFLINEGTLLFDSTDDQTLEGNFTVAGGMLAKTNSGSLVLTGDTLVEADGALLVEAVTPENLEHTMQIDHLTMHGAIHVSNLEELRQNQAYALLTTDGTLAAEIPASVRVPKNYGVYTDQDNKTLFIFKRGGTIYLLK